MEFNYYNREAETISPDKLRELQLERLKSTVERVYHGNEYYRKKFDEKGVKPGDIRHLEDITKLPFTTKDDLFNTYPTGLMVVSKEELVRYHMSSGTTGKPKVIPYTKNDIKIWTELMARSLAAIGITRDDVVQNGYGYGLFTGGLGIHQGAEALGATVIPIGGGGTERHLEIMRDMGSTAITCTPSYAIYLGETLHEKGIDPLSLKLKIGHHGAEPWTEEMRAQIEELWGFKEKGGGAYDIYGLSEMGGPGVATECQLQQGSHIWADHFIPEIVDPKTGEPLEPGEWGELVLTSITREAMPLIRYRVGDLTALIPEPCGCGRTHPRMEHITGRTDDMLIIRGVNVFPSQIEQIVMRHEELAPAYMIVVDRSGTLVELSVQVERREGAELPPDFRSRLEGELRDRLSVRCGVELKEPGELPRFEGKAKRVVEKRA